MVNVYLTHCSVDFIDKLLSQGAEKSQLPEVGIEPGPQDVKANTLPSRYISPLLLQGRRSVLYEGHPISSVNDPIKQNLFL